MLARTKTLRGSPPPHRSASLLLLLATLSVTACEPYDQPTCSPEARYPADHECAASGTEIEQQAPVAYRPDCIDNDGALCLAEVSWRGSAARRDAVTPGEELTLESITLANASDAPVELSTLNINVATSALRLVNGADTLLSLSGVATEERSEDNQACSRGLLMPLSACRFELSTALQVDGDAPVDQQQSAQLSFSYRHAEVEERATLSLPILVIDQRFGLELEAMELVDSSLDGQLQPGDRVRLPALLLQNHSLAPYRELSAQVSTTSPWVSLTERGEMWSDGETVTTGPVSDVLTLCSAATLARSAEGDLRTPGRCSLSFSSALLISPEAPIGEVIEFELRFKALDEQLPERLTLSYEVQALESTLRFEELVLERDEDGDRLMSPGERVVFNQLALFNEGPSALSLQGRLSLLSEGAELLSGSDLSVDLGAQEADFFERCLPGERCLSSIRVRLDLSPELQEGDEIALQLELIDQAGQRYLLEWGFLIKAPYIDLELGALRVTQDTLDERLSGGERGLISYLQIFNHGDADALGLTGSLWTDSPYIISDRSSNGRTSWPLELREMGEGVDTAEESALGRCVSTLHDPSAYCYQRLDLDFEVSPEAPIGERVTFWIDLTDDLGQAYLLSYELQLF